MHNDQYNLINKLSTVSNKDQKDNCVRCEQSKDDLNGFIEIPTRCILFIYLSAVHVSGYAHLQELQMYFANHRCVY